MAERPYHHGNLREELLDRAQAVVREDGVEALSLRSLARDIGVSHAAPRRHFADRQALLDACAIAGFTRLGGALRAAADASDGEEYATRMRTIAHAYIAFATTDADLVELMFSSKHGDTEREGMIEEAAQAAFSPVLELILDGQATGRLPAGDPERVGLVHLATIQGIATLLGVGMVTPDQVDGLVEDATAQFLAVVPQTQA